MSTSTKSVQTIQPVIEEADLPLFELPSIDDIVCAEQPADYSCIPVQRTSDCPRNDPALRFN